MGKGVNNTDMRTLIFTYDLSDLETLLEKEHKQDLQDISDFLLANRITLTKEQIRAYYYGYIICDYLKSYGIIADIGYFTLPISLSKIADLVTKHLSIPIDEFDVAKSYLIYTKYERNYLEISCEETD
jgi:hypothetical protein